MIKDPNASRAMDVPLGELVRSLASAVVEAQTDMDRNSMRVAEMMSGQQVLRDPASDAPIYTVDSEGKSKLELVDTRVYFGSTLEDATRTPVRLSMMELGFTPTFYQFVETTIEVRIAIRMNQSRDENGTTSMRLTGTPVDATYSQTYNYSSDAACLFKTRLVPIPAPPLIEQRIRALLEAQKAEEASKKG